jgi:hypothetical protein
MANWPDLPDLAGVVALLYQADWTRLSLAGKVSGGPDEPVLRAYRPGKSGNAARPSVTLHVAPGRRFRRDDGELVVGCDGERLWQWLADPPPDGEVGWDSTRIPPFAALLCPSWLLTAYDLEVLGPWIACGRDGIRVAGTARQPRTRRLGLFAVLGGEGTHGASRVEVVIDRELGILLRCKRSGGPRDRDKGRAGVLEFRNLEVGAVVDQAMFGPPPGSRVSKAKGTGRQPVTNFFGISEAAPFGLPFGPAKTAAGLAAGGVGAAIRYTPLSWLFRDEDGTGEPVPDDDPPPGAGADGAPVSDEVLYLLYRSGRGIPRFTGTSHFWIDGRAMLAGVPEPVRRTGLGGVGYLVDSLARKPRNTHKVSKVRMDGWQRYRIEPIWPPGSPEGKRTGPSVTACDGERYWQVHEDRVAVGEPRPAPADLADLTDTSWLLGCELSGGEPVTFHGRAAFRLSVRGGLTQSQLLWPGYPAVAVVDAETGRLIRLTCYGGDKPAWRHELRDVTPAPEGAGDDIQYAVPPGLPVTDIDSAPDPPDPSRIAAKAAAAAADEMRRQASEKLAAAKGFLGSLGKRR